MTTIEQVSKEQMIEKIYQEIADKTLSFGCKLIIYNPTGEAKFIEISDVGNGFTIMSATEGYSVLSGEGDIKEYTIIGHPVMIGDIFDWIEKAKHINNQNFEIALSNIYNLWQQKRLTIDDQSIECITYIYNIIKD